MPLKIAILEDNLPRQDAMRKILDDRCPMYEVVVFHSAAKMIGWLREHATEVIACSLDHDLEVVDGSNGDVIDFGTGRQVAEHLATLSPTFGVVIASTNVPAARGMEQLLVEGGWSVARITPYEDLLWLREAWWPAMRRTLLGAATSPFRIPPARDLLVATPTAPSPLSHARRSAGGGGPDTET
jgi:hypothetical protein